MQFKRRMEKTAELSLPAELDMYSDINEIGCFDPMIYRL